MFDAPSLAKLAQQIRADTPVVDGVVHLNAAGAGLPPREVTETVIAQLRREAAVGPHWAAAEVGRQLDAVRADAAALLGCRVGNVAFGPTAGRLWAMALLSCTFAAGSRVLVARSEWASNVVNLLRLERAGGPRLEIIPCDERSGLIDVERTAVLIDDRVAAICLLLGCQRPRRAPAGGGLGHPACDTSTSTWRSLATISSGLCFFLVI